jgi:DHA1 family tetracycline resistance protein-like MFS transporter
MCVSSFFDALALGASCVVLPNLAEALRFEGSVGTAELAVFGIVGTVAPCTTAVVWERLTERTGRRGACLVSGLCRSVGLTLMATTSSNAWLGAAVALWGTGAAGLALSTDAVSDLLPLERRPAGLGLLLASVALGFAAGANLGSLLPSDEHRLSLWICSSLSIAGLAYAWGALPESPPRERRRSETRAPPAPCGARDPRTSMLELQRAPMRGALELALGRDREPALDHVDREVTP